MPEGLGGRRALQKSMRTRDTLWWFQRQLLVDMVVERPKSLLQSSLEMCILSACANREPQRLMFALCCHVVAGTRGRSVHRSVGTRCFATPLHLNIMLLGVQ